MLVRRVARPLLATIFIAGGIDALRKPKGPAQAAEPVIDLVDEVAVQPALQKVAAGAVDAADDAVAATADVAEALPGEVGRRAGEAVSAATDPTRGTLHRLAAGGELAVQDETYVRINGGIQVGAGLLLATGRFPRLASAALAATLVPTTAAGHRFWEAEGEERKNQQFHFMKNVSLLGGLILAAADTEGKPGLAWKAQHIRQGSEVVAAATKANAKVAAKLAKADARAVKRLAAANAVAAGKGGKVGVEVAGDQAIKGWRAARRHAATVRAEAAPRLEAASSYASDLGPKVQAAGHTAADRAADLAPKVQAAGHTAVERAADLGPRIQAAGHAAVDRAAELAPKVQAAGHHAVERAAELAPAVQAAGGRISDRLPTS